MSAPKKLLKKLTILLYGRSRSGKTTLAGELAEFIKMTESKDARLYTIDPGGYAPVQPHVNVGFLEVVECRETEPLMFLHKAVRGYVRDGQGKWVPGKNEHVGLFVYESITGFSDAIMVWLARQAQAGISIGGGSNIAFQVAGDGEVINVGGNNLAHYGILQSRLLDEILQSQHLPGHVLWTAGVSKDEDSAAVGKVLGPDIAGKALTAKMVGKFNLTFRVDALAAQQGRPERHILYLGNTQDISTGNAVGLGNTRAPLDAPIKETQIEPASLVRAIQLTEGGIAVATEVIRKRMGLSQ